MTNGTETPQGVLPRCDLLGEGRGVPGLRRTPVTADGVEQDGGGSFIERLTQDLQVFGAEALKLRGGIGRFSAFRQQCCKIAFQGQDAPILGVELNSLEIHRQATAIVGVTAIEVSDLDQLLLCPVASACTRREAKSLRQQHGVFGNLLGGIEELGHPGRRHHQGIAHVHEPFAGCGICGELFGGIQGGNVG